MIEMIYSSKETEELSEVRVPKNIRQIGDNKSNRKIYIEDYVMTNLKKQPEDENSIKYGVLLGEIKRAKGNTYVFVKGLVETREIIEHSIIFNDDIWSTVYKDIKKYFEGLIIVGWFVSVPYAVKNDMTSIQKLHLDNFAGNDKVCYLHDRSEHEDGFFSYESGELRKQDGFYIFYEKNERMKKYLKQTQGNRSVPVTTESSEHDKVSNKKIEQIKDKTPEDNKNASKMEKVPQTEKVQMTFRDVVKKQMDEEEKKTFKFGNFAYGISSMLIVALLLSTVVMINNYGELKSLKASIENMNNEDSIEVVNEMLSSIMPTTMADSENVKSQESDEKSVTGSTQISNGESTSERTVLDILEEQTVINQMDNGIDVSGTEHEEDIEEDHEVQIEANSVTSDDDEEAKASAYSGTYHRVTAGQTLYDISISYYGNSSMVEKIKSINNINNDYMIQEGQELLLP